jgi:response regulator RpfG family c-di-GMP phosphodiesterase
VSTGSGQRLLLVDDNPTRRSELGFALESRHGYRVTPAATVREARDRLAESPDYVAVVTRATLAEQDAIPLLQRVTRTPGVAPVVVVIATPDEQGLRRLAWSERANAVLTEPLDETELAAALRTVLLHRQSRLDALMLQQELATSVDHLTDVLVQVLEAAVPGSAHRSAELVRLVSGIGAHFTMEPNHGDDLLRAARLFEVGRINSMASDGQGSKWPTLASARLIAQVPSLESVASLLEHVSANWDGSGYPPGIQRGEIPLRSRILRVASDALAAMSNGSELAKVVEDLSSEGGRLYDPAVVAALAALAAEGQQSASGHKTRPMGFDRLEAGMQLAADLHTVSGVKLLAAGTVLTDSTLQFLRRRHELDPLVLPVPVVER